MGKKYADVQDLLSMGIHLSDEEIGVAEKLIHTASAKLRTISKKYNKNIDEMCKDKDFFEVVKHTVVQAVLRAINSIKDCSPAMTGGTQSALGYSVTMTYLNAGQSLYFMRNELKELGILKQQFGALEVYHYGSND